MHRTSRDIVLRGIGSVAIALLLSACSGERRHQDRSARTGTAARPDAARRAGNETGSGQTPSEAGEHERAEGSTQPFDHAVSGAEKSEKAGQAEAAGEKAAPEAGEICEEHRLPEDEDGICHPELLAKKKPGEGMKVRLPSTASAAKAGIGTAAPVEEAVREGVECLAEIVFNQNKLAEITPLAEGIVKSIEVDLGSKVRKGDLLARLISSAMSEAQSAYLKALI